MLEFLVLGEVPGTHIQITFTWYLLVALILLSYVVHKIKKSAHNKKEIKQLSLFN